MLHLASLFDWFQSGSFIAAVVGIFLSLVASLVSAIREKARGEILPKLQEGFGVSEHSGFGTNSTTQTITRRLQEVESELSRQNFISKPLG
jgi:hypothetical protein